MTTPTDRRSTWLRFIVILGVLGLLAAACSSSSDPETSTTTQPGEPGGDEAGRGDPCAGAADDAAPTDRDEGRDPVTGGVLRFAVEADSNTYQPVDARWSISGNFIGSAIFEPLLVENGDGTVQNWLAESVTPNEDATVWTITAKDGIVFHDGTPFDADALVANIEARRDNPLTATANRPIDRVERIDDLTVEVHMKRPWGAYDHAISAVGGYIAAPGMFDGTVTDPTGTGPFRFTDWKPGDKLTVERNDDYWGEPARLDGIEFLIMEDVITRRNALEAGSVDAIITPDPDTILDFRGDDDLFVIEHSSEPMHLMLNSSRPPFDNPDARAAIASAIDQELLITAVGGEDLLVPAETAFVCSNPWHLDDNGYPQPDQDAARGFVEAYTAETGEDLSFTLNGSMGGETLVPQAIIEQLEAVGIDTGYEQMEQAAFLTRVIALDYQASIWRSHNWIDPDFNYIFWHSSTTLAENAIAINFTDTSTEELDAALDAGRDSLDPAVRREAYDDVQRILNEELTHIWLYEVTWALAAQSNVYGLDDIATRGLSRLEPKVFWGDVWLEG